MNHAFQHDVKASSRPSPGPATAPTTDVPDPSDLLPLARAAHLLPPTRGDTVAPSTLFRWATRGVVAADGARVKLRTVVLGRAMRTTAAWLAEFGRELAERREHARVAADPAAVAACRRAREHATRETLLRAGIVEPSDDDEPQRRGQVTRRRARQ